MRSKRGSPVVVRIPDDVADATIGVGDKSIAVTNLKKVFWPELHLTKRDLLQYYADVATYLLPHIAGKPMVMKRYPNGINDEFFFMKRAPAGRPAWIHTCPIPHRRSVIEFPIIDDVASLLWMINLGCIDLNPWYFSCAAIDRPEYLHFDLDAKDASFEMVREAAFIVRDALQSLGMRPFVKTSGGGGLHVYVAIASGPSQHDVWAFAKTLAFELARAHDDVLTAEYKIAKRPRSRVVVDYNQNSFGRTLASIYSVRPTPQATVSTPLEWNELEAGATPQDFTMLTVPDRLRERGDLWAPLNARRGRFRLTSLMESSDASA